MSKAMKMMALNQIFSSDMAEEMYKGLSTLTDDQFALAFKQLEKDAYGINKALSEAKVTDSFKYVIDNTITDNTETNEALDATTRILKERYKK